MSAEKIIRVQENQTFDLIPEGSQAPLSVGEYGIRSWRVIAPSILLESEYGLVRLRHAPTVALGYAQGGVAIDPWDPNLRFKNEDLAAEGRALKMEKGRKTAKAKEEKPTLALEAYNEDDDDRELLRVLSPDNTFDKRVLAGLKLQVGFPDLRFEARAEPLFLNSNSGLGPRVRFFAFYPTDTGPLPEDGKRVYTGGYHFTLPKDQDIPLVRGRLYFAN